MNWKGLLNVFSLSFFLVFSNTYSLVAAAQIIADPNSPKNQHPTILTAPNGTPLVNIQTPSDAGVSRNSYRQFDVDRKGAILNNSRTQVQSQLGGWIQANPWLNKNEARIILNEINSSNPSHLNGFIEVAGRRAEVVVANPSGISINGGGFINADKVLLTTGTLNFDSQHYSGISVGGGLISIDGRGFDARDTNYTQILSKALDLNAGLWANNLHISLGEGDYNATSELTKAGQGSAINGKEFWLDVSQLGGMYAGKIALVGTEAGVGIRNEGYIGASAGDIGITIDGQLLNKGRMVAKPLAPITESDAQANIRIQAGTIKNEGGTHTSLIHADNNVSISASEHIETSKSLISSLANIDIASAGNIQADADSTITAINEEDTNSNNKVDIRAQGQLQSQGQFKVGGELKIAADRIDLSDSKVITNGLDLVSQGDIRLAAAQVDASAIVVDAPTQLITDQAAIVANSIAITTEAISNRGGRIRQNGEQAFELNLVGNLDNSDGVIAATDHLNIVADTILNQNGQLVSEKEITITALQSFNNSTGTVYGTDSLLLLAPNIASTGSIFSDKGKVELIAAQGIENGGKIEAHSNLIISTGDFNHTGSIASTGNSDLNITGTATLAGTIVNQADFKLEIDGAAHIDGTIISYGQSEIDIKDKATISGSIFASGNSAITIQEAADISGKVSSSADLKITAASLNIEHAAIQANNLDLGANGRLLMTNADLKSSSAFIVKADNISAYSSKLVSDGLLSITSASQFDNNAAISSNGSLLIRAGDFINQANADIAAKGDAAVSANQFINASNINIVGKLELNAASVSNQANAKLSADAGLNINSQGSLDNRGDISSLSSAVISAATNHNAEGASIGAKNLELTVNSHIDNSGKISAENQLIVNSESLENKAKGSIFSNNKTQITIDNLFKNYGLVDGKQTSITTGILENRNTGRIYGDHLSIFARQSLINVADKKGGPAATIAARNRLDIAAPEITNTNGALIFSNDFLSIGGHINGDGYAAGHANRLLNNGATIESVGSMRVAVKNLKNNNDYTIKKLAPVTSNMAFIEAEGSNVKIDRNELEWSKWSRAGLWKFKKDAIQNGGGDGSAFYAHYRECLDDNDSDDDNAPCNHFDPASDYGRDHAIWNELKVTPPEIEPLPPQMAKPADPRLVKTDPCIASPGSDDCTKFQTDVAQYEIQNTLYNQLMDEYKAALAVWQEESDKRYDALDEAITQHNNQLAGRTISRYTEYLVDRTVIAEAVDYSDPGKIIAGGDMHFEKGSHIWNRASHIYATGTISGDLANLNNDDAKGTVVTIDKGTSQFSKAKWRGGFRRYHERRYNDKKAYDNKDEQTVQLSLSKFESNAGATISSNKNSVDPLTAAQKQAAAFKPLVTEHLAAPDVHTESGSFIRTVIPSFTLPSASIYQQNPDPGALYLIETDPRFANYRIWLNSDYILQELKFDGTQTQKRLGDGFYEQRLIREQINTLTGRNFLADYSSEEEQYRALMNSGIRFAKEHQLVPGIALTTEQMQALTENIVWLTSQDIVLADGTVQRVLVPQLYTVISPTETSYVGALISANNIDFDVEGNFNNQGSIVAQNNLLVSAENIKNNSGSLRANAAILTARNDIDTIGGLIAVSDSLHMHGEGDVRIETSTRSTHSEQDGVLISKTVIDQVAGIFVGKNASGDLTISAGKSLNIIGAEVVNESNQEFQLIAGGDVNIGAINTEYKHHVDRGSANSKVIEVNRTVGSTISSGGALVINAGNDVLMDSSQLTSANNINIEANDILISAAIDQTHVDQKNKSKTTSHVTTTHTGFTQQEAAIASLSGANIQLNGSGRVAMKGAAIDAEKDFKVGELILVKDENGQYKHQRDPNSPANLEIDTVQLTNESWEERSKKMRGLSADLAQMGAMVAGSAASLLFPGAKMPEIKLAESFSTHISAITHQESSVNAGNNIVLAAEKIDITSGNLNANNSAVLVGKNVAFHTAQNTLVVERGNNKVTASNIAGSLSKDQITLGGLQTDDTTRTERTTTTIHQGTRLNASNLTIMADNNIDLIASKINISNDAVLDAGNKINIEGRADSVVTENLERVETTTMAVGVKNAYVDAAYAFEALAKATKEAESARRALSNAEKRVKDGSLAASALNDYRINLAAATSQLAQAALRVGAAGGAATAASATAGFYATGSKETSVTETHNVSAQQHYQGSELNIGGNATFRSGKSLNIIGSTVDVGNTATLDSRIVNIKAAATQNSEWSESNTKTAGASFSTSGQALSANVGMSNAESSSTSTNYTNSSIKAGNLVSTSKELNLIGANVEIKNDIDIDTGRLTIASVQGSSSTTGKTTNKSIGMGFGGNSSVDVSSIGAGKQIQSSESAWVNNQTTLIGGGKMNIKADSTRVDGAIVANATRQDEGSLIDHGNLQLITNELIVTDIQDHQTSKTKGTNVSVGLSTSSSSSVGLTNIGHNKEQVTRATLGAGTITKKDGSEHNLDGANRDLALAQEITLDQQTGALDANITVDHRWATEKGRNQIKEDFDETGLMMQQVGDVLPSAENENKLLAGIGTTLDLVSTVTGGLIPSDKTEGGLIAQIPILIGQKDIKHQVIGEGDRIYVNGMMNNLSDAIQGAENIIGEGPKQVWFNPSRGYLSDLLESGTDLFFNAVGHQTGISKQAEEFQKNNSDLHIHMHSQGNIVFKSGVGKYINNNYSSYGSPMSKKTMLDIFNNKDGSVMKIQKNKGDYVVYPLNFFNPNISSEFGHSTKYYRESREKLIKAEQL